MSNSGENTGLAILYKSRPLDNQLTNIFQVIVNCIQRTFSSLRHANTMIGISGCLRKPLDIRGGKVGTDNHYGCDLKNRGKTQAEFLLLIINDPSC